MYSFYWIGILLAKFLPERMVYYIADLLGIVAYLLFRGKRRIIRKNLKVVFSKDIPKKTIKAIFCNYAHYYATLFRFFVLNEKDIFRLIKVDGWENLEKAIQSGRGVVVVSAHLGHWDLGGAVLGRRFKTNVLVERLGSKRLFELFSRFRRHQGMNVIPSTKGLSRLYTALANNEIVVILGDRDMDGKGAYIPFFGRMTTMPTGPAALARKTGAAIIPAFVIKERGMEHYLGLIEERIDVSKSEDRKRDIEITTLRITRVIERYIKRYPESWYMLQPIWQDEE